MMNTGLIGADPVALRQMAGQFDDAAHQLMGVKGSIQPWVDMTDMWLGLNYFLFKDMWEVTGARTVIDAASIFYRCAEVLRANAEAQDMASAAEGSFITGSGLFSGSLHTDGSVASTPSSTSEIFRRLHAQDPGSSDGIRIIVSEDESGQKFASVYLNGTGQDTENGLFGWEDAMKSMFTTDTETDRMIRRAMAEAGIDENTNVLLVGYSQGGMHAQNIAATGDFKDAVVLAQGSPLTLLNDGSFTTISQNHPVDGIVNGVELVTGQGISRVVPPEGSEFQYTYSRGDDLGAARQAAMVAASAGAGGPVGAVGALYVTGKEAHTDIEAYDAIAQSFDSSADPGAVQARSILEPHFGGRVVYDSK